MEGFPICVVSYFINGFTDLISVIFDVTENMLVVVRFCHINEFCYVIAILFVGVMCLNLLKGTLLCYQP